MDYVGNDVETASKRSIQECAAFALELRARMEVHFWTFNQNAGLCKAKGLDSTFVRTPKAATDRFYSGSVECGEPLAPNFGE